MRPTSAAATSASEAKDYVTMDLFEELIKDEEGHIDFIETQLDLMEKIGKENYGQLQADSADEGGESTEAFFTASCIRNGARPDAARAPVFSFALTPRVTPTTRAGCSLAFFACDPRRLLTAFDQAAAMPRRRSRRVPSTALFDCDAPPWFSLRASARCVHARGRGCSRAYAPRAPRSTNG